MAGVNLRSVQELMGHKRISLAVLYSHLNPRHTLAAVDRLSGVVSEAPTDTKAAPTKPNSRALQVRMSIKSFRVGYCEGAGP